VFLRISHSGGRAYLSIVQSFRDNGRTIQELVFDVGPRDRLSPGQIRELAIASSEGDAGLLRYVYRRKREAPGSENPGAHQVEDLVEVGGTT